MAGLLSGSEFSCGSGFCSVRASGGWFRVSVPVAAIGVPSRLWFVSLLLGSSVVGFWRGLLSLLFRECQRSPIWLSTDKLSLRQLLPRLGSVSLPYPFASMLVARSRPAHPTQSSFYSSLTVGKKLVVKNNNRSGGCGAAVVLCCAVLCCAVVL